MKIKLLKTFLLLALGSSIVTGCVGEDDYSIPTVFNYAFNEGFETVTTGSGANEVPITLSGWVNYNATNSSTPARLWHGRTFNNDKHAEFSSFFSTSGTSDEAWLITPAIDLTVTTGEMLSFTTKTRFSNGFPLTAFISTDYDGTTGGIATATWTPLTFVAPTADDVATNSGNIDISAYENTNVRIAFKYTGSKTGVSTTLQLDKVKITKN